VRPAAPWLHGALALVLGCGSARPAAPGASRASTRTPAGAPSDDPGDPDHDGVELQTGKGHVEPAAVEAGLRPHRDALARCYGDRVGRRRWLGGRIALHWDVAADGTFDRVVLAESDLGAWPIEKCVLDVARLASFGRPLGGPAGVDLPLEFSLCRSAAASSCTTHPPALWDPDASVRAVGGQLARLDACGRGKLAVPDDVQITAYVGPRGRVASVGFASLTSEIAEAWAACAEKLVLGWRLPDPKGQVGKLRVTYRPR